MKKLSFVRKIIQLQNTPEVKIHDMTIKNKKSFLHNVIHVDIKITVQIPVITQGQHDTNKALKNE